jgi:hypothetical protein
VAIESCLQASVFVDAFLSQVNFRSCVVQIQQDSFVTNLRTSASPLTTLLPSSDTPYHPYTRHNQHQTRHKHRHSRLTDYTIIQYSTYVRSPLPFPSNRHLRVPFTTIQFNPIDPADPDPFQSNSNPNHPPRLKRTSSPKQKRDSGQY